MQGTITQHCHMSSKEQNLFFSFSFFYVEDLLGFRKRLLKPSATVWTLPGEL